MLHRYITILLAANNASTIINFLVSLILARLLTPRDVGIFSMALVFVNITHTFRDFGVSSYLMREKDLGHEKLRSAMGLLIATSWSMAIVIFLTSSHIAKVVGVAEVKEVIRVLSLGFLLIPFGAVTNVLLKRNLDANSQAIVIGISTTVYASTCTILAFNGGGYMSMAWANFANIVASNIALAFLRPKGVPWMPSVTGWKTIVHFGGGAVLTNLLNNINNAVPDTLIGKKLSPEGVGLYSRANGLVELFTTAVMPAVNNVSLPVLSKRFHEGKPIHQDLCLGVAYLSALAWPILIISAIHSRDIILVLYGDNWLASAELVPLLCVSSAIRICYSLKAATMSAIGKPYIAALPLVVSILARVGLALLLGMDTLFFFVACLVIADFLSSIVIAASWSKHLGLKAQYLLMTLSNSAVSCIGVAVVSFFGTFLPNTIPPFFKLLIIFSAALPAWYIGIFVFKHPFSKEVKSIQDKVLSYFHFHLR
jgi:O-antigen/teichoic acid export membrane protein